MVQLSEFVVSMNHQQTLLHMKERLLRVPVNQYPMGCRGNAKAGRGSNLLLRTESIKKTAQRRNCCSELGSSNGLCQNAPLCAKER